MAGEESGLEVQKEIQEEAPISEWGISRVEQRLAEIVGLKEQMKEPLPEKEFEELLDESHQLNARKKELLSVGTREAVNIARLIKDGTLRNEDIERAFKRIEQAHPDNFELQEANFDLVRVEYAKLKEMVKRSQERVEAEKPEEIEKMQGEFEEIMKEELARGEGKLTDKGVERVMGAISRFAKAQQEMAIGGLISGMERPPDVKENVGGFKKWFERKLHALIEEYPDQSFETNWTLVYPLQQAVNSLWPKEKEGEIITDEKGVQQKDGEGNPYTYSGLRKELALELESHRNLHNYIFLHRRVSGVDGVVAASSLLEARYIDYLLRKRDIDTQEPVVAKTLRKLIEKGEEYKEAKDKNNEIEKRRILTEIFALQKQNWAGRVAGGLYSALHEAAKHDVILNESGDFFVNRLFNMPSRARELWEERWHREKNEDFYKALDLRVIGFWKGVLKSQLEKFKDEKMKELEGQMPEEQLKKTARKLAKKELEVFCRELNIEIIYEEDKRPKEEREIVEFSLKEAKFEEINLARDQETNYLSVTTDAVRLVNLDLMDADEIRKLILNPERLVERPGLDLIKEMWRPFKHLKGEKRSDWFRGVIKQIILLFKDQTAPDIETLPEAARRCPAKKIYPRVSAWLNPQIVLAVENLAPPLTKEDADKLLGEVVGPKPVREAKEYGKAAISAAGAMMSEFTKALLGLK